MKLLNIKLVAFAIVGTILVSSCSSTTIITASNVEKAEVYIGGELVGVTPYKHTDKEKWGASTLLQLDKEGYHSYFGRLNKKWFSGYQDSISVKLYDEGGKIKKNELDSKNQGQTM
ncbi:MAG: PEGA domain-containing protein [Bacteroidota bacterium]